MWVCAAGGTPGARGLRAPRRRRLAQPPRGTSLRRRHHSCRSDTIRFSPGRTAKGYYLSAFKDAFGSYLPSQSVTPSQSNNDGHCYASQSVTPEKPVTLSKAQQAYSRNDCYGVTLSKGGEGKRGEQSEVNAAVQVRLETGNGPSLVLHWRRPIQPQVQSLRLPGMSIVRTS
jgi:hypothetical protein